ncbi:DEAD/DEAH box helicase family protein [Nocardioides sp. zg-536]|uniref:DEAD/DEAH box helicase family protein n=1 Tax=Nocardioides faecalis TaxID=2803858 RepID=A0A939BUE1_9ACTN|nr:DEAD/DEAH box helicase family protein [Nocardioides faecalis]MBM9458771.1 DEAD/DEAH box helicase family protein [Nocardioides faecalis]QVI60189.1 DEAD/DEAH box helicase family protein [Nocardioides faecalis]
MKFTLKSYQSEAVDDVLKTLERARSEYRSKGTSSSVALSATTGAGKTVMAAAVIESLFWGSDKFGTDPDPGAVVIWFSDDPSLNEQTKDRLRQASEKFTYDQLVTVQFPFPRSKLEPRKVYFLNTDKLAKNSRLTRTATLDEDGAFETLPGTAAPDQQASTIWEIIGNTIDDPELTVYLILDEAHRGFKNKRTSAEKPTLVRQLINGTNSQSAVPIVWGISATLSAFTDAMKAADADQSRRAFPAVQVDPIRVQDSGLVKDVVNLDIPDEAGNFDTVLVRRAAKLLADSSARWERYAKSEGSADVVKPLLVLQVPNTPDHDQIGLALDEILRAMPELSGDSVRHVFGDHTVQKFGSWEVDWIEPQRVESKTSVRVLVAKDAISTGWDCPRAEVMVSFRPAKDQDHITQLLGRMVRNPLARPVPGDERLNSVDCILPFFDKTTAGNVAKFLSGSIGELPGGKGRKVLIDGRELRKNPRVPDFVWPAWDAMPTETMPQRGSRPVKRLVALAQALSADGVRPGALAEVEAIMATVLDSLAVRHRAELESAIEEVWAVRGVTISGRRKTGKLTYTEFVERADDRAIRVAFEDAKKAFGADVAQAYVDHLAGDDDGEDDGLREAYVKASALAIVKAVREKVDREADELAEKWFAEHRVQIKELSDERQQAFEDIRAEATEPKRGELKRPRTRMEDYAVVDEDGQIAVAPLADRHLMSDENGEFPLSSLNGWEFDVVHAELARSSCRAWYRNPARAAVDSLGVSYRDDVGNWRSMHPDFIFFNEVDGAIRPSIVDPHGHHLQDSLLKLQALVRFAKDYGSEFHRIEALAEIDGKMRVLDLQLDRVRAGILGSADAPEVLYRSDLAVFYDAL